MWNDHSIPNHSGHVDPPFQHDDDSYDDGPYEVSRRALEAIKLEFPPQKRVAHCSVYVKYAIDSKQH